MSPLGIDIILHYYALTNDYGHDGKCGSPADAPAVIELFDEFVAAGLLRKTDGNPQARRAYEITERGEVYANALLAVPLPIARWVIPGNRANGGYARAAALSKEQRTEAARKAANARWNGEQP